MNIYPSVLITGTCLHKEVNQHHPFPVPPIPFLLIKMFKLQISIQPLGLRPNFEQVGMGWDLVVYFLIALSWVMKIFSFSMHKAHAAQGTRFLP